MKYILQFIDYLTYEKHYSVHTVNSYSKDLNQFLHFCEKQLEMFDLLMVSHIQVREWIIYLSENNTLPRSVNRKISSLKSLYKFLLNQGFIKVNPVKNVTNLKAEKKLPEFVREEEIQTLLDEIEFNDDFEGTRDKLIIDLFYQTGIRRAELISLKDKDIGFNTRSIKVLGKRNKERIIPLSGNMLEQIGKYLLIKKNTFPEASPAEYLFLTKRGEMLYPKLVYRIVNKYLLKVSTIQKKSPHVIRHTFATHMLNKGADLNAIKEILGHANLAATEIYTHNTFEKLKLVYNQAHPRA